MPDQLREARRSSKSNTATDSQSQDRRRPSQTSATLRPLLKPTLGERPCPDGRTHSAPLILTQRRAAYAADARKGSGDSSDIDEVSPLHSPIRAPISPTTPRVRIFPSHMPDSPRRQHQERDGKDVDQLPEINIAVVGASGVGKSTFIQRSLELPSPPTSPVVARKIPFSGKTYLVRLLELPLDDVEVEDDDTILWPPTVRRLPVPRVDAALTLYDVGERSSFHQVPEMLNAIDKAFIPSMLVSCKCDLHEDRRQVDPGDIEKRAKLVLRRIDTLRTSSTSKESCQNGLSAILRAVISATSASRDPAAVRRRTLSNTTQNSISARPSQRLSHSRASSEYSGMSRLDNIHTRHDSSVVSLASDSNSKLRGATKNHANRSFLNLEESQESCTPSSDSDSTSVSDDDENTLTPDMRSEAPSDEKGYSFDNLVDRLLLLPKSKADSRFAAVFLALYRKFATPGQLLEAIVHRFEALEGNNVAFMARTVAQLRYLSVIEQWIGAYPGDFAHPKTTRRMRTFVSKLANTRIFTAAAREMSADLEIVSEDDDTDWAYCDKDRERNVIFDRSSVWSERGPSTLLDDPNFEFEDNLGSLTLKGALGDISAHPLPSNYGMLHAIDAARRQAQSLEPVPRTLVNKTHWRLLMDIPTDAIAQELTRIDWVMFSAIRPRDLVRHVSLPASEKAMCKSLINVDRMIAHFNHLRDWVATFILLRDKAKHRVLMLEKLMHVARKLRELNNYNSLGAFLAGINSSSVHRLAATRELLAPETVKDWMKLDILMSSPRSHSAYRLAWDNSSGERIPYIPLIRRDLVGALQGNKTFIKDEVDGRINWRKFEVMGEVVVSIQRAQGLPYRPATLGVRNADLTALVLNSALPYKDDEAMYERSLQLEAASGDKRGWREVFKR